MLRREDEPEPETGPLRRCVLTRQRLPKERMIRFVVGPDRRSSQTSRKAARAGNLVERFSGCARIRARARGQTTTRRTNKRGRLKGGRQNKQGGDNHRQLARAFARAARGPVSVPSDLLLLLQTALARRIGECLGLARRAGQAVAGSKKRGRR